MASKIATALGTVLLMAALCLWGWNKWEDMQAGWASSQHLQQLVQQLPAATESPLMLDLELPQATEDPVPTDEEMPETVIGGYSYIGCLSIPSLKLELPVMSGWDYEKLDVAPCRYSGTMKGENLVLLAHNFSNHFGKIDKLEPGDELSFTDMAGTVYHYRVAAQETLAPENTAEVVDSPYALTLFTCTTDSQFRVVVRCERM